MYHVSVIASSYVSGLSHIRVFKSFSQAKLKEGTKAYSNLLMEIDALQKLNHQHIVKLFEPASEAIMPSSSGGKPVIMVRNTSTTLHQPATRSETYLLACLLCSTLIIPLNVSQNHCPHGCHLIWFQMIILSHFLIQMISDSSAYSVTSWCIT